LALPDYRDSHPDLHPQGATEFLRVKAAYELITRGGSRTVVHGHCPRHTTGIHTHAGLERYNIGLE
jgi:hypothetical protein